MLLPRLRSCTYNARISRPALFLLWAAVVIVLAHSVFHIEGIDEHPDCPLCQVFGGLTPVPVNILFCLFFAFLLLHNLRYVDETISVVSESGVKSTRGPPSLAF